MTDKIYNWTKIAEDFKEFNFAENSIAVIELEEKKICIAKFNDKLFAFSHQCPHAGGILSDGYLDALGNVVCPQHHYRYNIRNGRNTSGEGYFLKTWPVEIREDGVYIGIETMDLFGNT